jgi:recombination protein RecA
MAKKSSLKIPSLNTIRKSYNSSLASDIYIPKNEVLWLPSRSIPLNWALGGGIPYGRIAEIFGAESSGKSLLGLDFAYAAQRCGGIVLFNDAEQAFDPYWAEQNGLDVSKIEICNEVAVEKVSDWLLDMVLYYRSKLVNNEPIVFIQDSIAALDTLDSLDTRQTDKKAEMGNRAKAIYTMLRIRNKLLAELGVVSIFINQVRSKLGVGMFGDPDTTTGGNAMKYFASQRIGINAGKQEKIKSSGRDRRIGINISIRLIKNKVSPPRPTFKSKIYFDAEYAPYLGIDRYLGLVDILMDEGVLSKKKGHSIYYDGEKIAAGMGEMERLIEKDKSLRSKLVKESGIHTISKLKSRLKKETINKYKIKEIKHERQTEE